MTFSRLEWRDPALELSFRVCSFVRSAVWGHPQNLVTFLLAALTATSHTSVPCQLAAVLQETRSLDWHRAAESTEHPWIGTGQQKAQSILGSAQGSRKHRAAEVKCCPATHPSLCSSLYNRDSKTATSCHPPSATGDSKTEGQWPPPPQGAGAGQEELEKKPTLQPDYNLLWDIVLNSADEAWQGSLVCCSPWGPKSRTQLSNWKTTRKPELASEIRPLSGPLVLPRTAFHNGVDCTT